MKVLIDHPVPFTFAHGGVAVQIEQTKLALSRLGVEVDYLRWWDDAAPPDLVHYFGRVTTDYLCLARRKGIPVILTPLFTDTCNRSETQLRWQGRLVNALLKLPTGEGIKTQLGWRAFSLAARNVVGLQAEQHVLEWVYQVPAERTSLVPLGLSRRLLEAGASPRTGSPLICVGTITERKNSVPLARLARQAQVPVLFVGKPYSTSDPYWQQFSALIDGRYVLHHPHVSDEAEMIALLHASRGAVVMSRGENWCFTAHEAVACGLPLLLPDLPWSRECFGNGARYFSGHAKQDAEVLRGFHADCPRLPVPAGTRLSWDDVALRLRDVYADVLRTSR